MNVQATRRRMVMVMEVEEGVNSELYYKITQGFRAMNINEALRKANNKLFLVCTARKSSSLK